MVVRDTEWLDGALTELTPDSVVDLHAERETVRDNDADTECDVVPESLGELDTDNDGEDDNVALPHAHTVGEGDGLWDALDDSDALVVSDGERLGDTVVQLLALRHTVMLTVGDSDCVAEPHIDTLLLGDKLGLCVEVAHSVELPQ